MQLIAARALRSRPEARELSAAELRGTSELGIVSIDLLTELK